MSERPKPTIKTYVQRLACAGGLALTSSACGHLPLEGDIPTQEAPAATEAPEQEFTFTTAPTEASVGIQSAPATSTPPPTEKSQPQAEPTLAQRPRNLRNERVCYDSFGTEKPLSQGEHHIWDEGGGAWDCRERVETDDSVIYVFRGYNAFPGQELMYVAWDKKSGEMTRYGYGVVNKIGRITTYQELYTR